HRKNVVPNCRSWSPNGKRHAQFRDCWHKRPIQTANGTPNLGFAATNCRSRRQSHDCFRKSRLARIGGSNSGLQSQKTNWRQESAFGKNNDGLGGQKQNERYETPGTYKIRRLGTISVSGAPNFQLGLRKSQTGGKTWPSPQNRGCGTKKVEARMNMRRRDQGRG